MRKQNNLTNMWGGGWKALLGKPLEPLINLIGGF